MKVHVPKFKNMLRKKVFNNIEYFNSEAKVNS